jgi:hypothetical protein
MEGSGNFGFVAAAYLLVFGPVAMYALWLRTRRARLHAVLTRGRAGAR